MHLAEAIESKHRVRERLVRAMARSGATEGEGGGGAAGGRLFDPVSEEIAPPETELGLNPLGEYLLTCELQDRAFRL